MKIKDLLLEDPTCNNFLSYINNKKGNLGFGFINNVPVYFNEIKKQIWIINQSKKIQLDNDFLNEIIFHKFNEINLGENTSFDIEDELKLKYLNFSKYIQGISTYDTKRLPTIKPLSSEFILESVNKKNFEESINFLYEENFYPQSIKAWKEIYYENILGFIIRNKNNKIVANISCVYQTDDFGVIWGVATNKKYRKRGLATHLVMQIIDSLISLNKRPLLYFTDEKIGNFYKKMGFETNHYLTTYLKNSK
ncbi:GNAT family N-acetyltransferase [Mycoplasma sp. CSL10166]|uniref:GNAT family N-acetyltransferase n=1 Tax=Mycoplasma sp. CSL10166 TaxID=2813825 RepID=UPI00197B4C7B|nr:GNAT family N-acetyltransferase [Mycoplasma sp. CSL10166]MBN4084190.1 GNAT family N-acetyltransferase [Mycoplasma sp. CSL10166]